MSYFTSRIFLSAFVTLDIADTSRHTLTDISNYVFTFRCYSLHTSGDGPPTPAHMPQDALSGPGIPVQARAFNTLMHGEVSSSVFLQNGIQRFRGYF